GALRSITTRVMGGFDVYSAVRTALIGPRFTGKPFCTWLPGNAPGKSMTMRSGSVSTRVSVATGWLAMISRSVPFPPSEMATRLIVVPADAWAKVSDGDSAAKKAERAATQTKPSLENFFIGEELTQAILSGFRDGCSYSVGRSTNRR